MIIISQAVQASQVFPVTGRSPLILWRSAVTAIEAEHETEEHPASDLLNSSTVLYWLSDDTGEQTITLDCVSDTPIDCVAFEGQNFASGRISVLVEGITADEGASFEELVTTTVGRDGPLVLLFTPGFYTQIKVTLTSAGHTVAPRASILWAGTSVRLPVGVPPGYTPMTASRRREAQNNISALGHYLGSVVLGEFIETSIRFQRINGTWYREHLEPFQQSGSGTAFFFAPFPVSHPKEVGFCWLTDTPAAPIAHAPNEVDFSMQFGAVGPAT